MFGKSDSKKNLIEQENKKDAASENRKLKRKKTTIFTCFIAVLLVIGLVGIFVFNSVTGIFSANTKVSVMFNSTGGSEIQSQTVLKGEKLTEVGIPVRNGYMFAGWYYEEAPVNAYKADDVFKEDTTLYAGWFKPDMESDIQEYINGCDSNITFAVHSDAALTDDNLSDYISFSCIDGEDGSALSVKPQDDGYLLYSKDGFTPGLTYSIELLDTNAVYFIKAGDEDVFNPGIRVYNFTIYRENVNGVVMKANPKLLSSDDISDFEAVGEVADGETGNENDNGKTIYRATLVKDDGNYQVGDIISLGSGEEDAPENEYYKVSNVSKSHQHVDLISPNMDDIYSEFEVYYSGDAVYFEDEDENEETRAAEKELQTSIKESEGYDYLCTAIAMGIKESPTLRGTVAGLSINNQKRFEQLSIDTLTNLLKNVEVKLSIQKTYDIANKENGVRGTIKFSTGDIDIKLDDKIKLTLNLTLTNELTETVYGYISLQENFKAYINKGALLTNHCNLDFSAVIGTTSGEKKINITEEIQKLINSSSDDKTQTIVDNMNQENFFGSDLDYVEIFSKELGEKTVAIYEVLTVQFKLNFHVDIGMRVGLNLNFDSTEVRKIGLCNMPELTGTSGMARVNQRLSSRTHFSALLKGQMGIRAGFKAEVNFSVVHLNKVANFGFSVDVGVYEEISGFVRFDYDTATGMSMAGGMKSETGIFLGLDFNWNLFGWNGSVTIAEFKFPILTIGSVEFASEFETTNNAITFNTTSYNIKNSSDSQLKLKYIDISGGANGVTINVKPASLSEDYMFFKIKDQTGKGSEDDLKYVSVDQDTGIITIADNAPERLDFSVAVQYTRGYSLFSKDLTPITKRINLTYMKYKVDDSTKKYKATFYDIDGSVLEQKEYYVGQVPVSPAEDLYANSVTLSQYKLANWSKPWKEEIKAIYGDADYHLDWEYNHKNINFYGSVYNQTTGKYEYGLIATVPTLFGELPTLPKPGDMDAEPGWEFEGWSPELYKVDADYNYTAVYRQDSDYCFYNFYVNGNRTSYGLVKIGDTPAAPDMSGYNTANQQFVGWWPSLGPTTSKYQIYNAVFRKYVNVTFKNREGKVLSEKQILAGETPEAPKIDDTVEGEEDYYEYYFNRWESEEGAKIGQVYKDTIYSPVYDKKYLEVTTIFDAGDHAFADGTKTKEHKGVYAKSQNASPSLLYMPQVTYRDNQNTYKVDYWQSTEMVNGSYVKLDMSKFYTYYKYNLTFKPVFKAEPIVYTVRFDGGDEIIYLTGQYGDIITVDMLAGLKKTSQINNYVYELRDYGLTLPYRFGSTTGTDGLTAVYISVVAKFELVGINKTFAFDANGGKFADNTTVKAVTAPYGTRTSFNEVPVKADDNQYTYAFIGWADNKDAVSGSSYSDFVMNGDKTLYAVYSRTPIYAALTFNSASGRFADGSTQKTLQVLTGSVAPAFDEIPLKDSTAYYEYAFTGWNPAYQPGTVVNSSVSYYAQYSTQMRNYTVTFDAGGGYFEGGVTTIDQTYHYGDTLVPPSDPARDGGTGYEYVFDGWAPSLTTDMTVTFDRTFTATYRMVGTGAIGETGIIVTKGGASEDINVNGIQGVGNISGYSCEMVDYGGAEPVPRLTITGNGLTFSGSSDEVCVVIEAGVTDVTFNDLTLSGAYTGNAVLDTDDTASQLTIHISGSCVIRNTVSGYQAVRFERPVLLAGTGSGAELSISAKGYSTSVYCANTLHVDSLEMEIAAQKREGDAGFPVSPIGGEDSGGDWIFEDSTIRLVSEGSACAIEAGIRLENSSLTAIGENGASFMGDMWVSGASVVNIAISGEDAVALRIDELIFDDFTGSFSVRNTHSTSPGIAVMAEADAIVFKESGTEVGPGGYDLGGTEIGNFDSGPYSSFGIWVDGVLIPASSVTVTKP